MFIGLQQAKTIDIDWPDIYFTPEYGEITEKTNQGYWECYYITNKFIYVYFVEGQSIKDIYGYAGMYLYHEISEQEFQKIRQEFLKKAKERGYKSEFIKVNPYLSNFRMREIKPKMEKITYGIKLGNIDDYWKTVNSDHRNMVRKALRLDYIFEFRKIIKGDLAPDSPFRLLYNKTMENNKAKKFYYFDDQYFDLLEKLPDLYIANVLDNSNIIGSALFIVYKCYIHYHLSCSNKQSNCISDCIIYNTVKYCCENFKNVKLLHLGGGLSQNDSLAKFKKKISNCEFQYLIYDNKF